jgi:hypothetical protein
MSGESKLSLASSLRGTSSDDDFERELRADARFERLLFWRILAVVLLVAALVVLRAVLG